MQLYLLIFSLFSIIGPIQGSESYDYNPNVYDFDTDRSDFGTGWLINIDDQETPREQEQITYPLSDWAEQVRDETEPPVDTPVDTPEEIKCGRFYKLEFKLKVLEFCEKTSIVAACEKFKLAYTTVWQWFNKEGKGNGKKYTEEYKTEALELYTEGNLVSEICKTCDVPRSTLWRCRKEVEFNDCGNGKRKRESYCEDSDTGIKKEVKRRKYEEKDKIEAVKLYDKKNLNGEEISISAFAREHKIPGSTLRGWIEKYGAQQ